ncbi:hypothetical protein J3A78_002384 [Streptomyces sp. PvR006]|uniref:hypothetical protein n=1 Tax=Streptomyces sp. PvR006 TaxID=2817860 RepID=UPI001AE5D421|nr:hypothetical protein [Streptomyces sp. PvR006]MBP2581906.1 hypothetical protein [Streptomyces sp. PvR006]
MAASKPVVRKKTTATRRKPVKRAASIPKPRAKTRSEKLAVWAATTMAKQAEKHTQTVTSRKDAAILRMTHEGCARCKGNGQIFTQGKDGAFTGSKPCPAKPTKTKVSRMRVAMAARFGADKNTGLVGWTCPCGTKEKPRYRDAKAATAALRTHERKKHGGKSVGGAWYGQVSTAAPDTDPAAPSPEPITRPISDSGMTDEAWEAQNKPPLAAETAKRKGVCWCCVGEGRLFSAYGGEQLVVVCNFCRGTGKPTHAAPA